MSPEGERLVAAARRVFEHLDEQVGDPSFRADVDVLRRFVFGALEIPIGGPPSEEPRTR